jgi:hypothetical protein
MEIDESVDLLWYSMRFLEAFYHDKRHKIIFQYGKITSHDDDWPTRRVPTGL